MENNSNISWMEILKELVVESWGRIWSEKGVVLTSMAIPAIGYTISKMGSQIAREDLMATISIGVVLSVLCGVVALLLCGHAAIVRKLRGLIPSNTMLCSFNTEDAGCHVKNTQMINAANPLSIINADYYRIKISAIGAVRKFEGNLVSVISAKRGIVFEGENLKLTPAHFTGEYGRDIRDKNSDYLDVLCITQDGAVMVATHNFTYPSYVRAKLDSIAENPDEYVFRVLISAEGDRTIEKQIRLIWTGNWRSSKVDDMAPHTP